ncbi:MAG TPA: HAMP domain-containing sensor histidine kinase [Ktedonobacterales bacterium]
MKNVETPSGSEPGSRFPLRAQPGLAQVFWRDPLLLGAWLIAGLLVAYQLAVTLLQPSWAPFVTNWFRVATAWPGVLVLVWVSVWLTRTHRPGRLAWWLLSVALIVNALGKTLAVAADQFLFHYHRPMPWWPDLFYVLEYLCLYAAMLFLPGFPIHRPSRLIRARVVLDSLLVMGAATALSSAFLMVPLYLSSTEPGFVTIMDLFYPVADLGGLLILTFVFTRRWHQPRDRAALYLLMIAALCLIVGDSWYAWLTDHASYRPGTPPDLFWVIALFLAPLAALVQCRLAARDLLSNQQGEAESIPEPVSQRGRAFATGRFLVPFVAAMLAGGIILARTLLTPRGTLSPIASLLITFGLLLLVTIRQAVSLLENDALRRERALVRANEQAMRETNRQMEDFLGIVTHELRTPLTSIIMGVQMMQRRLHRLLLTEARAAENADAQVAAVQALAETALEQLGRLNRLVNDLVDISRIQSGRLEVKLQPVDLAAIAEKAVEEQRQIARGRTIVLLRPLAGPVPVFADAERIGQVIANYLTNALKYSGEAAPVEVGVRVDGEQGRVWVRDQGPGIPSGEQAHIWERFHRSPGIEVQSGSGIGLGLGLHISRTIIEHHHGQVGVESTPGKGATFWFTLPLAHEMRNEPMAS